MLGAPMHLRISGRSMAAAVATPAPPLETLSRPHCFLVPPSLTWPGPGGLGWPGKQALPPPPGG